LLLIDDVLDSFCLTHTPDGRFGLPLGNVTSQLFANLYLHELDMFVKQTLRQRYFIRYCDDFIILADDRAELEALIRPIQDFLATALKLTLHPDKIVLRKLSWGLDFVGYVQFFDHRLMRTATKRRMLSRLALRYKDYQKEE
jgi:retron-type reverse transcriptase